MTAQSGGQAASPGQGIKLRTRFFVLDWTVRFTRTTVRIDGEHYEAGWGERYFPLEPGRHQLQVSFRYLRMPDAGKASICVDVASEQVVRVSYRAPRSVLIAFRPGKLAVQAG